MGNVFSDCLGIDEDRERRKDKFFLHSNYDYENDNDFEEVVSGNVERTSSSNDAIIPFKGESLLTTGDDGSGGSDGGGDATTATSTNPMLPSSKARRYNILEEVSEDDPDLSSSSLSSSNPWKAMLELAKEYSFDSTFQSCPWTNIRGKAKDDYRTFLLLIHPRHGLLVLHCTRKKKKPPHYQLPGGHVDKEEFELHESMLYLAGRAGGARELWEETKIDMRNHPALDRLLPLVLYPNKKKKKFSPPKSRRSKSPDKKKQQQQQEGLPNEYKKRLFFVTSVTDDDFIRKPDLTKAYQRASISSTPDTNTPHQQQQQQRQQQQQQQQQPSHLWLQLSVEHSGFRFVRDPSSAMELLHLHSGGKVSKALAMALDTATGGFYDIPNTTTNHSTTTAASSMVSDDEGTTTLGSTITNTPTIITNTTVTTTSEEQHSNPNGIQDNEQKKKVVKDNDDDDAKEEEEEQSRRTNPRSLPRAVLLEDRAEVYSSPTGGSGNAARRSMLADSSATMSPSMPFQQQQQQQQLETNESTTPTSPPQDPPAALEANIMLSPVRLSVTNEPQEFMDEDDQVGNERNDVPQGKLHDKGDHTDDTFNYATTTTFTAEKMDGTTPKAATSSHFKTEFLPEKDGTSEPISKPVPEQAEFHEVSRMEGTTESAENTEDVFPTLENEIMAPIEEVNDSKTLLPGILDVTLESTDIEDPSRDYDYAIQGMIDEDFLGEGKEEQQLQLHQAQEEAIFRSQSEASRQASEQTSQRWAEEEARLMADLEDARQIAERYSQKQAEEQAQLLASKEDERLQLEAAARRRAEENAQLQAQMMNEGPEFTTSSSKTVPADQKAPDFRVLSSGPSQEEEEEEAVHDILQEFSTESSTDMLNDENAIAAEADRINLQMSQDVPPAMTPGEEPNSDFLASPTEPNLAEQNEDSVVSPRSRPEKKTLTAAYSELAKARREREKLERERKEHDKELVQQAKEAERLQSIQRMEQERKQLRQGQISAAAAATSVATSSGTLDSTSGDDTTTVNASVRSATTTGKQLVLLISTMSGNATQKSNQEKVIAMLQGKNLSYVTIDGSDPTERERWNELFTISGIRGNYPQLFLEEAGNETKFVGDFDTVDYMNESGTLADLASSTLANRNQLAEQQQLGASDTPATRDVTTTNTTASTPGDKLVFLLSKMSGNATQKSNQERLAAMLKGKNLPYTTVDGSDPSEREERNELFAISGIRGNYPQLFLKKAGGETKFVGDFDTVDYMNESGGLADLVASTSANRSRPVERQESNASDSLDMKDPLSSESVPSAADKKLTLLISKTSGNATQKSNQERLVAMLTRKGLPYITVDGSDPSEREKRNELFAVSGIRGNYPQLFMEMAGGETAFVGDFDTIDNMNESGTLSSLLTPCAPPVSVHESDEQDEPGAIESAATGDDGPTVVNGKSLVILLSSTSGNATQKGNQERAMTMLNSSRIRPEVIDGSDPSMKDSRNRLFGISGIRGNYPQFFLKQVGDDDFSFIGTFDAIESMNDEGPLEEIFG